VQLDSLNDTTNRFNKPEALNKSNDELKKLAEEGRLYNKPVTTLKKVHKIEAKDHGCSRPLRVWESDNHLSHAQGSTKRRNLRIKKKGTNELI
jgi:hypothetical protein